MGFGTYLFEGDSEAFEDPGGHAFAFPKEADEQVLGADVGVVHAAGFIHRQFHYFFGPWGEAYFALGGLFATADDEFNGGTDLAEVHAQPGEDPGGYALRFPDQAEEDVLGTYIVMVKTLGLFLRQRKNSPRPFREFFESAAHNTAPVG